LRRDVFKAYFASQSVLVPKLPLGGVREFKASGSALPSLTRRVSRLRQLTRRVSEGPLNESNSRTHPSSRLGTQSLEAPASLNRAFGVPRGLLTAPAGGEAGASRTARPQAGAWERGHGVQFTKISLGLFWQSPEKKLRTFFRWTPKKSPGRRAERLERKLSTGRDLCFPTPDSAIRTADFFCLDPKKVLF
jgi:hypothetical protein